MSYKVSSLINSELFLKLILTCIRNCYYNIELVYIYVFLAAVNIAEGRTTWQSGTGWSGVSSRAVDGNNDGDWWSNSCTCTNQADPWWAVDLGSTYEVTSVVAWNRVGCCRKFK